VTLSNRRAAGARRAGRFRPIFALAHTMIVIVWHILHDNATYDDLGADYFERPINNEARQRHLVRQLEALGHKVTIEPAA
jgi:transposase